MLVRSEYVKKNSVVNLEHFQKVESAFFNKKQSFAIISIYYRLD